MKMQFVEKPWLVFLFIAQLISYPLCAQTPSTKGTEFWIGFIENLPLGGNGSPEFSLLISADNNASGTISFPATGYTQNFSVQGGQCTQVNLPSAILYAQGSEIVDQKGMQVTSDNAISVVAQHHRAYFSEASTVLPLHELGDSYMIITYTDSLKLNSGLPEFVIVAAEDNTVVDITPSATTQWLRPAGTSFSVTLQKGQTYQVQAKGDLTGSLIKTRNGKRIAVYSGSTFTTVKCAATSPLYDMAFPMRSWGSDYMLMPFTPGVGDLFRILAAEDDTKLYFNCGTPITLNKGEFYEKDIQQTEHLQSSKPVAVGQFKKGQFCSSQGDCSFQTVMPFSYRLRKALFRAYDTQAYPPGFTAFAVNIITKTADAGLLRLDNQPVSFSPIANNAAYSEAKVDIQLGSHELVSDSGFYAFTSGFGDHDGYTYFFGYDGKRTENTAIKGPGSFCVNTAVNFSMQTSLAPASWQWSFGDNTTAGASVLVNHAYANAGSYPISVFGLDGMGCPFTAEKQVTVKDCHVADSLDECEIFVPTAFSPNNNGRNDMACTYGFCIRELLFRIYDRWGELVFETNDKAKCWDGTYKGKELNSAVFAWTLTAKMHSGRQVVKKGNITLVK